MMNTSIANIKTSKHIAIVFVALALIVFFSTLVLAPDALAVRIGDQEIEGYKPTDMIQSDINIDASDPGQIAPKLEQLVIVFVQAILPILMIACVVLIIYNAIRNIFRKPEDKVKIGALVKEIFVGFFWILFAWIIVEIIVFIVTNGESLIYSLLFT